MWIMPCLKKERIEIYGFDSSTFWWIKRVKKIDLTRTINKKNGRTIIDLKFNLWWMQDYN
jgi:hypothetical protein